MVNLTEQMFIYDGQLSYITTTGGRSVGLVFAHIDTEHIRTVVGRKTGEFVYNKATKSRYLVGDSYEDSSLEMDVEIVTCDGSAIGYDQLVSIERWLFVNSTFKKLEFNGFSDYYDDNSTQEYDDSYWAYFNCRFLYPEKIENEHGIIGFKCVLQTDSMMMYNSSGCTVLFSDDEIIVDESTGDKIIKGDADGDGVITSNDVKTCRTIATWGSIGVDGNPIYSISDFYNPDGTVKPENLHILNLLQLPKTGTGENAYISKETLNRCFIACNPYYTQRDYELATVIGGMTLAEIPLEFREIEPSYASFIQDKMDVINSSHSGEQSGDPSTVEQNIVIKGDADGDGDITAADASVCLKIATWHVAGYTIDSFFNSDGTIVPENEAELNTLQLPKPITKNSLLRCLIACDLSYTQDDFDAYVNEEEGSYIPDISNVEIEDAQEILKIYAQRVAQLPSSDTVIDISGSPVASVEDVRSVLFNVKSYIDGYTYPSIDIYVGEIGGTIEIENTSDYRDGVFKSSDRKTVIINTVPNSVIKLNSEINMIDGISYNNMKGKYFPRLINGANILHVKGDVLCISARWENRILL